MEKLIQVLADTYTLFSVMMTTVTLLMLLGNKLFNRANTKEGKR